MDSSSIFKVYVREHGSEETLATMVSASQVFTSIVAYAEVRSALARARRDRRLTSNRAYEVGKADFQRDWRQLAHVLPDDDVTIQAGDLAENHALSGFDAIHLSSALTIAPLFDDDFKFSTWDRALARAASAEGLSLAHEVIS